MPKARIYKPARNAMQSGWGNTRRWVLEFEPEAAKWVDPLMGWTGSRDMRQQVKLRFDSRDDAVAYAERQGLAYRVFEPAPRRVPKKSYADRFAYDKVEWP